MTLPNIVGVSAVVVYLLGVLATRWMFIARPNRRFTAARVDEAQYFLEKSGESTPTLLDEARDVCLGIEPAGGPRWLRSRRSPDVVHAVKRAPDFPQRLKNALERLFAPLVWNGSHELVAWGPHAPRGSECRRDAARTGARCGVDEDAEPAR